MAQQIKVGTVKLNRGVADRVVGSLAHKAVERAAGEVKKRVEINIRTADLIDTGEMLNGITAVDVSTVQLQPRFTVTSTAEHSAFQEFGTRAHGPVRAQFLRFTPKGSDTVVFTKWVRGVTASRFMQRAKDATSVTDFLP